MCDPSGYFRIYTTIKKTRNFFQKKNDTSRLPAIDTSRFRLSQRLTRHVSHPASSKPENTEIHYTEIHYSANCAHEMHEIHY